MMEQQIKDLAELLCCRSAERHTMQTSQGVTCIECEAIRGHLKEFADAVGARQFNPETVKLMDLAARKTALLAMELARICLLSFSVQVSEDPRAQRIRDICYTLLGTTGHRAEPDEDAAFGRNASTSHAERAVSHD